MHKNLPYAPDNNQGPPPPFPIPYGQQPPFGQSSNFTFGPIASIQNNETGQPAWLVIGHWRSNLLSFNQTTTTTDNSDGNSSSIEGAVFSANLRMIMLNGSGAHTHVITNFVLSNVSSNENGTMTNTGNSTISMPEAPIVDVPTTIKISGEIISIFPDPSRVEAAFRQHAYIWSRKRMVLTTHGRDHHLLKAAVNNLSLILECFENLHCTIIVPAESTIID